MSSLSNKHSFLGFIIWTLNFDFLIGMDYPDPKKKNNFVGKIILAATLTALCIIMLKQSPAFNAPSQVSPSPSA